VPSGTDLGTLEFELCPSESKAFMSCYACVPLPDDDATDQCLKTSCCQQMKAYLTDSQVIGFVSCLKSCYDSSCQEECKQQFPGIGAKFDAAIECGLKNAC
jgi:hypothetical protein